MDPETCTLPTAERPLRVAEFDALFREHLRAIDRRESARAVLSFVGPVGLTDRVQDLSDRETSCCSFFEFDLSTSPTNPGEETVALQIRVPTSRADVLAALAARAAEVSEASEVSAAD